jgi:hypothetical protein
VAHARLPQPQAAGGRLLGAAEVPRGRSGREQRQGQVGAVVEGEVRLALEDLRDVPGVAGVIVRAARVHPHAERAECVGDVVVGGAGRAGQRDLDAGAGQQGDQGRGLGLDVQAHREAPAGEHRRGFLDGGRGQRHVLERPGGPGVRR